jgi:hypothetical protein
MSRNADRHVTRSRAARARQCVLLKEAAVWVNALSVALRKAIGNPDHRPSNERP